MYLTFFADVFIFYKKRTDLRLVYAIARLVGPCHPKYYREWHDNDNSTLDWHDYNV